MKKRVNTDAMLCNANDPIQMMQSDAILNCFYSKYTSAAITN